MPVKVYVTDMLATHLGAEPQFTVSAKDLDGLLDEIEKRCEGFRDSICDENGYIRQYVSVFVNGENVRPDPSPLSTRLNDGDEVYFLASVAGGSGSMLFVGPVEGGFVVD